MELFLNLCWLALLLPAYLLWRRKRSSGTRASFVIICTLGCALVLLFPVISASDDLHAVGQAMEESKRGLQHGANCSCGFHSVSHSLPIALQTSAYARPAFRPLGAILSHSDILQSALVTMILPGRAPPSYD